MPPLEPLDSVLDTSSLYSAQSPLNSGPPTSVISSSSTSIDESISPRSQSPCTCSCTASFEGANACQPITTATTTPPTEAIATTNNSSRHGGSYHRVVYESEFTMKELKLLLERHNISHKDCVERKDLVERIRTKIINGTNETLCNKTTLDLTVQLQVPTFPLMRTVVQFAWTLEVK